MTVSPKLGTRHSLEILKVIRNGLLLDGGDLGEVLLPSREVEGQTLGPGDSVMVTLYSDGEGRSMASLRTPRVQLGQVASLKVVSTSKVGAFVDWGMPKDLLLPFAEQKGPVREESWVLVMLTTDREGRLMVSAQLDRFLSDTCQAYQQGDEVSLVAAHSTDLGYKVVVDDHAWGMIAASELRAPLRGRLLAHRLAAPADGDVGAQPEQPLGHGLAQAGAAAGDEDALPAHELGIEHGVSCES